MGNFNAGTFLAALNHKGIVIDVDEDNNLNVEAPKGVLDHALVQEIKARKLELVDYLSLKDLATHDRQAESEALAIGTTEKRHISPQERDRILNSFNNTAVEYPAEDTVVGLFQEQVKANPNKIGLVFEDTHLTYQQLDDLSTAFALALQEQYDLQPEALVGIKLERSNWLIVSILAVLKCGGAYVPIDPEYPKLRIDLMLKEGNCKAIIDEKMISQFQENGKVDSTNELNIRISPNHLAYVMYTSGSTGKPKGVMVEHRGIVRLVKSSNFYQFDHTDILLSTGSVSFDATTFEYWGPLLNGATLVLASQDNLLNADKLAAEIADRSVNVMWFTAAWLNQLVDSNIGLFGSLQTILAGGDKLSEGHIKKLKETYPDLRVINGYGPTENTTFSTTYEIQSVDGKIPIGKPISNSTVYIVDGDGNLLPVGIPGEIWVGGHGIARGYLNRPELTQEKFIPNPFWAGTSVYKTGDYGKWLPDGNIEFIGRIDSQYKIRGYRIELGEIEDRLNKMDMINEAVILVKEDQPTKYLVAFYTGAAKLPAKDIASYLSEELPDYMVPQHFVYLDKFPLNLNGKVDRKALNEVPVELAEDLVPPSNPIEWKLVEIWSEILKLKKGAIGTTTSFFSLGGHSLILNELLTKIKQEFDIQFSAKEIFKNNTIQLLGTKITEQTGIDLESIVPEQNSNGREEIWFDNDEMIRVTGNEQPSNGVFNTYFHQKRELLHSLLRENYSFNLVFHLLYFNLDQEILEKVIHTLFQRHESLRTTFSIENGAIVQRVHDTFPPGFEIEYIDLTKSAASKQTLDNTYQELTGLSFDFSQSLIAIKVVEIFSGVHGVLVGIHHVISDKTSRDSLKEEMGSLYDAFVKGLPNQLKPLSTQLRGYTRWVNHWPKSEKGQKSRAFYKEAVLRSMEAEQGATLNTIPSYRQQLQKTLPADFDKFGLDLESTYGVLVNPYPGDGAAYRAFIGKQKSDQLKQLSQQCDSSLFMLLIASFALLMKKMEERDDVRICIPYSTRIFESFKPIIGWLTCDILACLEVNLDSTLQTFVQYVTKNVLETADHRFYPIEQIVSDLDIPSEILTPFFLNLVKTEELFSGNKAPYHLADRSGYFKIDFTIHEYTDGISCELQYDTSKYTKKQVEDIMNTYLVLLDAMIPGPEAPLHKTLGSI